MAELLNIALQATTQEQQKKASDSLNAIVEDTNEKVLTVKNHLEELKRKYEEEGEDEMSAEQATPVSQEHGKNWNLRKYSES